MNKSVAKIDLLVSCPSDVKAELGIINEVVDTFNRTHGEKNNIFILTKHWSTDSYPESGDYPQPIINRQIVKNCDMAVAVFWTRFGTPTDEFGSGTEEEIETLIRNKKQVFVYFSDCPINPSTIDHNQYQKILDFRKNYPGLYGTYSSMEEFKKKFSTHLNLHLGNLIRSNQCTTDLDNSEIMKNSNIKLLIDEIHNDVQKIYIKKKFSDIEFSDEDFKNYSSLLTNIITIYNKHEEFELNNENLFKYVSNLIFSSQSSFPLKVQGPAGTGKSTFLSILYLFLSKNELNKPYVPFYIDIHIYECEVYKDNGESCLIQTKRLIDSHLQNILEFNKLAPDIEIIIIIDGLDEYEHSKLHCEEYILEKFEQVKCKKKIIGLGKQGISQTNRSIDKYPEWAEYCIDFHSVSKFDEEIKLRFIKAYSVVEKDSNIYNYIIKMLKKYSIVDIDLNTINLLATERSYRFDNYTIDNITDLYSSYCQEYLYQTEKLSDAASMAYNYAMTTKKFTEKEIIGSKSWSLIHKHKSFCNYLIAYYIISRLKDDNDMPIEILKTVYPYEINMFMKELLNENFDTAKRILKKIKLIYDQCNISARTHLCYLLGRIKFKGLQDEIIEFLNDKIVEETRDNCEINALCANGNLREKFLLIRTLSISLAYLGVKNASNEYISQLLKNPYLNNLNRGFHLEYYGDIKFIPDQDALIHEDNLESFPNTYKKLTNQISKYVKGTSIDDPLFEINVFTLCSLAQHRNIINKLPEYQAKKIVELTDIILSTEIDINSELRDYILLVNENLKKDKYDPLIILDNLYETKMVFRTGWVRAKIERPESIADHMYSSMWIATICLPDKIPNEVKYDKQRIKDMLFIHDIGEVSLGDKTPSEMTDDFRNKEDMQVKQILMHDTFSEYNMFPSIQNLSKYRELWNEWFNCNTINSRIARDIDVIDRLYQYNKYKRSGITFSNDDIKNWEDDKYNVKTSVGRKILKFLIEEHFEGKL